MSFKNLGISEPILKSLTHKGYKEPTPIQEKSIPAILEGLDVMAAAQTGTGKTASFYASYIEYAVSSKKIIIKGIK